MKKSRVKVMVSAILGSTLCVIGFLGAAFWIMVGLIMFFDDMGHPGDDIICFFIAVVFIVIFLIGIRMIRRVKRFRQYVALISTQGMTSLVDIAANTAKSVEFVTKDLQKMIRKNFFVNASINAVTKEIIIVDRMGPISVQEEKIMVTCSGCGALGSKFINSTGYCNYCGSLI